jgi:hypothetical protein
VAKLLASLQLHMTFEEESIYPLLAQVDGEMEQEAEVEHGLARDGIAKLTELVGAPGFGAAVEMVKAGISHHVEEEEQEAFPEAALVGRRTDGQGAREHARPAQGQRRHPRRGPREREQGRPRGDGEDAGIDGRSSMTKEDLIAALTSSS